MKTPVRQSASIWPPLPGTAPGMRIGLYGGSFNPPHKGHAHVSDIALKRLGLDRLWWLVTPGNPLKNHSELAPLENRMAAAQALTHDPCIEILSIEADIGVSRSLDTVQWLKRRLPPVRFVWVMGADNLAGFHRWHGWRQIAELLPIAVIDRPGYTQKALASPAARKLDRFRLQERDAQMLCGTVPPAWVFLRAPLNPLSSTLLRANGAGAAEKAQIA
ncbi:MAG: nicotinate-nucleotide adenylyltransferase [Rhodobiaceae bacterium]|nr:nicotinate-nucleotide adenylyltransferase [Rhodobiaceae bacterium]MCC0049211.1 nicotinate-nucleotide adenylyltransferase [Rhodobiaceae bacterium]